MCSSDLMGEEDKFAERVALLQPYQVNMELVKKAGNENLIFLHCLPAFHDTETVYGKDVAEKFGVEEMEVTDEALNKQPERIFLSGEPMLIHRHCLPLVSGIPDNW